MIGIGQLLLCLSVANIKESLSAMIQQSLAMGRLVVSTHRAIQVFVLH